MNQSCGQITEGIMCRIREYLRDKEEIYIYGAGRYGFALFELFTINGIAVNGFVISEKNVAKLNGVVVLSPDELSEKREFSKGVFLAMNEDNQRQVKGYLREKGIDYFGPLYNYEFEEICRMSHRRANIDLETILMEKPATQRIGSLNEKRILVIQLDQIGDLIWTSAFLRELKKGSINSTVTMIIRPQNRGIVENCPYIDRLVFYNHEINESDAERFGVGKKSERARLFFAENFAEPFDTVFLTRCIQEFRNIDTLLLALYSGATERYGFGYINQRDADYMFLNAIKPFFTRYVGHVGFVHHVDARLDLLRLCGISITNTDLEAWFAPEDAKKADTFLKGHDKIRILVALNGSTESKNMNTAKWERIIEGLKEKYGEQLELIIVGGQEVVKRAENVNRRRKALDLSGKTSIGVLTALAKKCDGYIGPDTGIGHIMAAFKKPTVIISTWIEGYNDMSPDCVAPWNTGYRWVHPHKPLDDCEGYCNKEYAHCIDTVDEGEVISYAEEMIDEIIGGGLNK